MSPDNIVHVSLPREGPAGASRYATARSVLERWLAGGVWVQDAVPALYPYEQTYRVAGVPLTRAGFVALGEVSDYPAGQVLPHERTHAAPKQDRLQLLAATGADTGLLFMLVSDPDGTIRRLTAPRGAPVGEARDLKGELHRLWRVTDEPALARVQALMAGRQAIIADGHHRYETAVAYADRHPGARWKLMAFFALETPGLTILPNHRLVHGLDGFSLRRLLETARPWFEPIPLDDPASFAPTRRAIGVVTVDGAAVLHLRPGAEDRVVWPDGAGPAWRGLAVSLLHEGILRPILGITGEMLEARSHVDYTADQDEAIALARRGQYQAAFLIAATTAGELQAVVRGGELLPQKSTHFYPKLLDGLLFHMLETDPQAS
jgi:uncharacterized protein (DUF1015 family)